MMKRRTILFIFLILFCFITICLKIRAVLQTDKSNVEVRKMTNFSCKGSCNDEDELTEHSTLKIMSPNKMLLGKPFNMTCKTRVPPHMEFTFHWIHDGDNEYISTYNSTTLSQQKNGLDKESIIEVTLIFSKVKRSHEGEYTCLFVAMSHHKMLEERMFFNVLEKFHVPKFDPESNWYESRTGQTLKLKCSGKLEVLWRKMEMPPVDPYSKQELVEVRHQNFSTENDDVRPFSSTLILEGLKPQETGNYTCLYKSFDYIGIDFWEKENYNLFRNAYVFVGDLNEMYVKTPNVIMENNGFPLNIPCRPTFPEVEVTLYKTDDETLMYPRAFDSGIKFSKTDGFSLPMREPYVSKTGYVCVFAFDTKKAFLGFELLLEPSLTYLVKPTLLNFKPNPEYNKPTTLICHMPFLKNPPARMQWRIYTGSIEGTEVSPMIIKKQKNYNVAELQLKIKKVTEQIRGKIECAVYDKDGHYFSSTQLYFDINYPRQKPMLFINDRPKLKQYTVQNGNSVTLTCLSTGPVLFKRSYMDPPQFDVTGKFNNFRRQIDNDPLLPVQKIGQVEIPLQKYKRFYSFDQKNKYQYRSQIVLTNLTGEDAGSYSCMHAQINFENMDLFELIKNNNAAAVYIYVKGANRLDVPSVTSIMGIQGDPIVIPCVGTEPSVNITLYRNFKEVQKNKYNYQPGTGYVLAGYSMTLKLKMMEKFICEYSLGTKKTEVVYKVNIIPHSWYLKLPQIVMPEERPLIGATVTIGCYVNTPYFEPISFTFLRTGKKLIEDKRMHIKKSVVDGQKEVLNHIAVTIKDLKLEDEGNFECSLQDYLGRVIMNNFYLDVFDSMEKAPVILGKSSELLDNFLELNSGTTATLKCGHSMKTTWFFEIGNPKGDARSEVAHFEEFEKPPPWTLARLDQVLETKQYESFDKTSDLPYTTYINHTFTHKDVGYYVCVNNDDASSKDKDTETLLKQKRASRIYIFVKDDSNAYVSNAFRELEFKENTDVIIPCRPSSSDIVAVIYKFGYQLPPAEVFLSYNDGFLVPRKFLTNGTNYFSCIFSTTGNRKKLVQTEVITTTQIPEYIENPKIEHKPMEHKKYFSIVCSTRAPVYSAIRIKWIDYPTNTNKPDSNIIFETATTKLNWNGMKEITTTLKIKKVNARHQGIYKCQVEDIYENVQIAIKDVKIYGPPKHKPPKLIPPAHDITISYGDLMIECEGDSPVKWTVHSQSDRPRGDVTKKLEVLKKQGEIPPYYIEDTGLSAPSSRVLIRQENNKTFLRINDVNYNDTGFYSCVYKDIVYKYGIYDLEKFGEISRVYVYVNKNNYLYKPISNNKILYIENTVFTIPCLPTSKDYDVKFYNEPHYFRKNSSYVSFDPRFGFTIYNDSILNINRPVKCIFQNNPSNIQYQEFTLQRIPVKFKSEEVKIEYIETFRAICKTKLDKNIPYTLTWWFPLPQMVFMLIDNSAVRRRKGITNIFFRNRVKYIFGISKRNGFRICILLNFEKNVSYTLSSSDVTRERAHISEKCTEKKFHNECVSIVTLDQFTERDSGYYFCSRNDIFSNSETVNITLFKRSDYEKGGWKLLFQDANYDINCGKTQFINERLLNNTVAKIGQYPWTARIGYPVCPQCKQIQYFCAGALLGFHFVLTSGQCINGTDNSYRPVPVVRLGDHEIDGRELFYYPRRYQIIRGVAFKTHPLYMEADGLHDIGIILLEHQATLNNWVYPICLPRNKVVKLMYDDYERYVVAGWGAPANDPPTQKKVLLTGNVENDPSDYCPGIRPKGLCTTGEANPCRGDAGVPLVWTQHRSEYKNFYAVGLVSKVASERCDKYIATLPNITNNIDFIIDTVEKLYVDFYHEKPV